ncbi:MAG: SufE family protein [Bacteroidales bacterium]|nr:SufE family protein [Bacteroidales bacterium]
MTIKEIENQIVGEFANFEDWMDKYSYLIELGRECPAIDLAHKTENNLIKGCQSNVWLHCEYREGRLYFSADSDAVITKGIIALLIRVFNGQPAKDIMEADLDFIDTIGLKENLSPTRSNGLTSMIAQLRNYAKAYALLEATGKVPGAAEA